MHVNKTSKHLNVVNPHLTKKHNLGVKSLSASLHTNKAHNSSAVGEQDSSFPAFMNTSQANTYISTIDTDAETTLVWPITCGFLHLMNCVIKVHRSADPNTSYTQWFPVADRTKWVMNKCFWSINPRILVMCPSLF